MSTRFSVQWRDDRDFRRRRRTEIVQRPGYETIRVRSVIPPEMSVLLRKSSSSRSGLVDLTTSAHKTNET